MQEALDKDYWDKRYKNNTASWDVGRISTPLKEYIDQLADKNISILIPGCGNAHEAEYLLENGFTNITVVDISDVLIDAVRHRFGSSPVNELHLICDDFFNLHQHFDLIIEQTFFCALDPSLRKKYADKVYELLKINGKLAGVFFNRVFEISPPFGGSKEEYVQLFSDEFTITTMDECYNSIAPRKGAELFVILRKTG